MEEEHKPKKRGRKPKVKNPEEEIIKKEPKKRGRRRKCDINQEKIFPVVDSEKTDSKTEEIENIILKLNIDNFKEHENNKTDSVFENTFFKYQPNIHTPDAYDHLEFDQFTSEPFTIQHSNKPPEMNNKIFQEKEQTNNKIETDSSLSENKEEKEEKSKEVRNTNVHNFLKEFVEREDWPLCSSSACLWCCHTFDNNPFGIPIYYNNETEKFMIKGCFCSLECASSYNFYSEENTGDAWERYNLINLLSQKLGYQNYIKLAPKREVLKFFGGYMSIDEFRNHSETEKIINIQNYPMISTVQQLEEINDDIIYKKRYSYIPVNNEEINRIEERIKLKRNKPVLDFKNTLDHAMKLVIN